MNYYQLSLPRIEKGASKKIIGWTGSKSER
jgi:hypothetical protein